MTTPKHPQPKIVLLPRWLGRLWLRLFGWQINGSPPADKKYVMIGAPHTSNWDFPFMLAVAAVFGVRISWMGKDSLFKNPLGGILRRLGGIPIDRSRASGVVNQLVKQFKEADEMVLVVPPSGTRKKREYWKSGFYWIASNTQTPIVCAYLDFARKEAGIGPSFVPSGNITADMDRIRDFYQDIQGKHPELTSRIRLREEDKA